MNTGMMDYDSFQKELISDLKDRLASTGIEVKTQVVHRTNETLTGITFPKGEEDCLPILYVRDLYQAYQEGESYWDILTDSSLFALQNREYGEEIPDLTPDYVRENLFLVVVNYDENREMLKNVPFERLEDLAVAPKVSIPTSSPDEEASFFLQTDTAKDLNMTPEEVLQTAHANMEEKNYLCRSLSESVGIGELDSGGPQAYVLTNETSIDGAAAIVSRKAMKEAREMIGEDFMILPSSRHEVILIPRSNPMSVGEMERLVHDANRVVCAPADRLSDHVYRYHSGEETIKQVSAAKEGPARSPEAGLFL